MGDERVCIVMCLCVCVSMHVSVCVYMSLCVCVCVSLCVCVCVCLCLCVSMYVCLCLHVCLCLCLCVSGCVCLCLCVCVCLCLCVTVGVCLCLCVCLSLCMFACVYVCVCVCVYVYLCVCLCVCLHEVGVVLDTVLTTQWCEAHGFCHRGISVGRSPQHSGQSGCPTDPSFAEGAQLTSWGPGERLVSTQKQGPALGSQKGVPTRSFLSLLPSAGPTMQRLLGPGGCPGPHPLPVRGGRSWRA